MNFKNSKQVILWIVIFLFIFSSISLPIGNFGTGRITLASYISISVSDAKELIDNSSELFLLDVRASYEYENGHIPGAYLIPYTDINTRKNELPSNKSYPILVYCRSGVRSRIASETLVSLLYTKVFNMNGGFIDWANAGFPTETGSFTKPTANTTFESSSNNYSLSSSSSTTSLISPSFEIFFTYLALSMLIVYLKKRYRVN
ncbi:MAG: rhodanese-like domain-containing protein [Candidatus Hodarchaeales archaeon]|jgi:rhodanese-related sulfurtransferase